MRLLYCRNQPPLWAPSNSHYELHSYSNSNKTFFRGTTRSKVTINTKLLPAWTGRARFFFFFPEINQPKHSQGVPKCPQQDNYETSCFRSPDCSCTECRSMPPLNDRILTYRLQRQGARQRTRDLHMLNSNAGM